MRLHQKLFGVAALLLLAACAQLGLQQPTTLEQRLAYAYGQHTAVLTAAANSLQSGSISTDDAMAVLRLADESRTLLDASKLALTGGDVSTAEGRLLLATNILQQLLDYLNARAKP